MRVLLKYFGIVVIAYGFMACEEEQPPLILSYIELDIDLVDNGIYKDVTLRRTNIDPTEVIEQGVWWEVIKRRSDSKDEEIYARHISREGSGVSNFTIFPWSNICYEPRYKYSVVVYGFVTTHSGTVWSRGVKASMTDCFSPEIEAKLKDLTVTLTGAVETERSYAGELVEKGFYWSYDEPDPEDPEFPGILNKIVCDDIGSISANFQVETGISPRVYCFTYAMTPLGTMLSNISTLFFPSYPIEVSLSPDYTNLTHDSVTLFGSSLKQDNDAYLQRGFCYIDVYDENSTRKPSIYSNTVRVDNSGPDDFSATITGLEPETWYKIRAFAQNNKDHYYSDTTITIRTPAAPE